jgi:MtN3 and saliva related transmembrane protein
MESATIIGTIAATATTVSFIPQAVKVIRTRDTRSISLWMYLLFSIGISLWLVYGILKKNPPIICANGITLAFALVILVYKITEKK